LQLDYGWGLGFALLIVFLTISLSRQMAQRNQAFHEAQIRSARLELDLLKKHIQPHFLLNSLNSIIAWLEEDPQTAARLVNALADELRLLLKSGRTTVGKLSEELKLCRAHLSVMSLRYGKEYSLTTENVTGEEIVPPLVIHTLVENGLTHGYAGKERGIFILKKQEDEARVVYTLFNDSAEKEDENSGKKGDGTGGKYITSRLEEVFSGRWSFSSHRVPGGWEAVITIRKGTP